MVEKDSATLDGAINAEMKCDHRQLNRFVNGKDRRFIIVKEYLRMIERDARRIVNRKLNVSKRSPIDDSTFAGLGRVLNVVDFWAKRTDIESASGNSKWILDEPAFIQWSSCNSQDDRCPFLWVSGNEGLGKSKAALAAVEQLEEGKEERSRDESEVMVAYFFCDSSADCQSAENLLSSLMWQLVLKRRSLGQYIRGLYVPKTEKSTRTVRMQNSIGFSKLWSGLQDMLRDDSAPRVFFVVNNIHYLAEDSDGTKEFLRKIKDLLTVSSVAEDPIKRNVNWMFLSRPRDNIKEVLEVHSDSEVMRVNLDNGSKATELHQGLKTFTQERVKALARFKRYSLALQYFLTSVLVKEAENDKLWVEVVCCLLENYSSNYVVVRETLDSLPPTVKDLMSRVWKEVSSISS